MLYDIKSFITIKRGEKIWKLLNEKYDLQNKDFVFVLLDESCLEYWDKYLDIFVKRNKINRVILLADLKYQGKIERLDTSRFLYTYIDEKKLKDFSTFYTIFTNDKCVQFLALDIPFGRNADSILGLKGITLEDIVYTGMLNLGKLE